MIDFTLALPRGPRDRLLDHRRRSDLCRRRHLDRMAYEVRSRARIAPA
jgi:hypothetical protein